MIKEAMQYFWDQSQTQTINIDGAKYTNKPVYPAKLFFPAALELTTLMGLKECVKNAGFFIQNRNTNFALHIESIESVSLISQPLGDFEQRQIFATAHAGTFDFPFDEYCDREKMQIEIMSSFLSSSGKDRVLAYIGGVARTGEVKMADDGITQRVTTKTGIARVGDVEIENPISLSPYRSFPEIEPVAEDFIFRVRKDEDYGIQAALFNTKNERWRVETVARIKSWLLENIPKVPVLA